MKVKHFLQSAFFRQIVFGTLALTALFVAIWPMLNQWLHPTHRHRPYNQPDMMIKEASITFMGLDGRIKSQLKTAELTHYPTRNATDLIRPHFIFKSRAGEPWHVKSDMAQASEGIDSVTLLGHVNIHQSGGTNNQETDISTSVLHVLPKKKFAETDQAITIKQPSSVISSVGLKADLEKSHLELLSDGFGQFELKI